MSTAKTFREDFDILINSDYVYFDNAATSQRPRQVLEAVDSFYKTKNANPLRGLYDWSMDATEAYENARKKVAEFIGAGRPEDGPWASYRHADRWKCPGRGVYV